MKSEDLYNAITDVDDSLIEEAGSFTFTKKKNKNIMVYVSAAAAIFIAVSVMLAGGLGMFDLFSGKSTSENAQNSAVEDSASDTNINQGASLSEEDINKENITEENDNTASGTENLKTDTEGNVISLCSYPKLADFPGDLPEGDSGFHDLYTEWYEDVRKLSAIKADNTGAVEFSEKIMKALLSDTGHENKLISPFNIYMALSVLAETADNNTRKQLLDALGANSIEELRETAGKLWQKNYRNDGYMKSICANSLWMNDSVRYKKSAADIISENYFASVFSGKMGSVPYNNMINKWISDQTEGMLSSDIRTFDDTPLVLVSTILYKTRWRDEFDPQKTEEGVFHTPEGEKTVSFMKRTSQMYYYWGENFSAIRIDPDIGGDMWFILPDEGVRAEEMFTDSEVLKLTCSGAYSMNSQYKNSKFIRVNMSIPKFDISQNTDDIKDALSEIGITEIYDSAKADFSQLFTDAAGIFVSKVSHNVRLKADEEGVSAAAYTALMYAGSARPPEEEVDFVLDRPFAFILNLDGSTPLFAGVVNTP